MSRLNLEGSSRRKANVWARARALAIAGLVALSLLLPAARPAAATGVFFNWWMADRMGADTNGDGVREIPNTWADVHPTSYLFHLEACKPLYYNGYDTANVTWSFSGPGSVSPASPSGCSVDVAASALGAYQVTLNVNQPGRPVLVITQPVTLKNYLIVIMGDSYASGEGNPDIAGNYNASPVVPARWVDKRCHRSFKAAGVKVAKALEDQDLHSSVTLVDVACSGATIDRGLIGGWIGQEPPPGAGDLLPQIEQVYQAVGDRQIDALMLTIGGNDIGFFTIASECVTYGWCWDHKDSSGVTLADRTYSLLNVLPGKLATLKTYLANGVVSGHGLRYTNLYLPEYFDPTKAPTWDSWAKSGREAYCSYIVDDIQWPGSIDREEEWWAVNKVINPLNSILLGASPSTGNWHYVGGVMAKFQGNSQYGVPGHGYCAGSQSWIRRATDAAAMQGPADKRYTTGTLHPNETGHQTVADLVKPAVQSALPGYGQ